MTNEQLAVLLDSIANELAVKVDRANHQLGDRVAREMEWWNCLTEERALRTTIGGYSSDYLDSTSDYEQRPTGIATVLADLGEMAVRLAKQARSLQDKN